MNYMLDTGEEPADVRGGVFPNWAVGPDCQTPDSGPRVFLSGSGCSANARRASDRRANGKHSDVRLMWHRVYSRISAPDNRRRPRRYRSTEQDIIPEFKIFVLCHFLNLTSFLSSYYYLTHYWGLSLTFMQPRRPTNISILISPSIS